jgi:hypothetical protein
MARELHLPMPEGLLCNIRKLPESKTLSNVFYLFLRLFGAVKDSLRVC